SRAAAVAARARASTPMSRSPPASSPASSPTSWRPSAARSPSATPERSRLLPPPLRCTRPPTPPTPPRPSEHLERTAMTPLRLLPPSILPNLAALALAGLACAGAQAAPGTVSLTGAPSASASEPVPLRADEAALVGAWQEGLTSAVRERLTKLPADRAASLRQMLGDTLVIRPDHTMTIYPRCAQRAAFGKAGEKGLD